MTRENILQIVFAIALGLAYCITTQLIYISGLLTLIAISILNMMGE